MSPKATYIRKPDRRQLLILSLLSTPKKLETIAAEAETSYDSARTTVQYLVTKGLVQLHHIEPRRSKFWISTDVSAIQQTAEATRVKNLALSGEFGVWSTLVLPAILPSIPVPVTTSNSRKPKTQWRFPHGAHIPNCISLPN